MWPKSYYLKVVMLERHLMLKIKYNNNKMIKKIMEIITMKINNKEFDIWK